MEQGISMEAQNRLHQYEQMQSELIQERDETCSNLERMKEQGKERSYRYRELLGKKALLNAQISLYHKYGLEPESLGNHERADQDSIPGDT